MFGEYCSFPLRLPLLALAHTDEGNAELARFFHDPDLVFLQGKGGAECRRSRCMKRFQPLHILISPGCVQLAHDEGSKLKKPRHIGMAELAEIKSAGSSQRTTGG